MCVGFWVVLCGLLSRRYYVLSYYDITDAAISAIILYIPFVMLSDFWFVFGFWFVICLLVFNRSANFKVNLYKNSKGFNERRGQAGSLSTQSEVSICVILIILRCAMINANKCGKSQK